MSDGRFFLLGLLFLALGTAFGVALFWLLDLLIEALHGLYATLA